MSAPAQIGLRRRSVELCATLALLLLAAFPRFPEALAQEQAAGLEVPAPDICRLLEPGEALPEGAGRLADRLLQSLPDGTRRLIRWPRERVLSVRYQDYQAIYGHLPRRDFVRLLTQAQRHLPLSIDGQERLPVGSANFRYIRKDYGYRDAADQEARAPGDLERMLLLGYHDYPVITHGEFVGVTPCAGMVAFDQGYRAVAGALSIRRSYCGDCFTPPIYGAVPPRTGLRNPQAALTTPEEHGACLLLGLQWGLGVPGPEAERDRLDLAALLYHPALRAGMTPAAAGEAILLALRQADCGG